MARKHKPRSLLKTRSQVAQKRHQQYKGVPESVIEKQLRQRVASREEAQNEAFIRVQRNQDQLTYWKQKARRHKKEQNFVKAQKAIEGKIWQYRELLKKSKASYKVHDSQNLQGWLHKVQNSTQPPRQTDLVEYMKQENLKKVSHRHLK